MEKLKVKAVIEILGTPQEHVDKALNVVAEKLKEIKDAKLIAHKVFPSEKVQDKPFWTGFVDAELEMKDTDTLLDFCFDFMPSSVEIIEPMMVPLQSFQVNRIFNDVLARMHQYDMYVKNIFAENKLLKKEIAGKK